MLNKVIISRKVYTYCTRFIQVGTLVFTIQTQATNLSLFKAFNPRVKAKSVSRTPQSYYADVNYSPKPEDYKTVIDYVFVHDHAGVLEKMSNHYGNIFKRDEYIRNWDLSSLSTYSYSTIDQRKSFFNKVFLKYIDKRISGSLKRAKKGSTLAQVGQVQKTLTPSSEAVISENFKVKLRAKVLKGLAIIKVDNPYVDCNTYLSLSDGIMMQVQKKFATRTLASVDYNTAGTNIELYVQQGITNQLTARVSAKDIVGGSNASHELRLNYSSPFNF